VRKELAPYLPVPQVVARDGRYEWDWDRPKSIGKVRSFWGQIGVLVRAYAYIRACGPDGLKNVSQTAILAANYLAAKIRDVYPLPFGPAPEQPMSAAPCAHEFISVPRPIIDRGVSIMDIAKNLIDRGIHPPTVHFPVHDCLMIEPTETESKAALDQLADDLLQIAALSETSPQTLKASPQATPVRRLDEVQAARKPVLRWNE
jgi:glycine dehydrogenase subunit 2